MRIGETLSYSLSWGFLGKAATFTLASSKDDKGNFVVEAKVATQGLAQTLYPFDAHSSAVYGGDNSRLMELSTFAKSSKFQHQTHTVMDYERRLARHQHDGIDTDFEIPDTRIIDLTTLLFPLRDFSIQPGSSTGLTLFFEEKLYPATLSAVDIDRVRTPLFTRNAVRFQPQMNDILEGLIKRETDIKIWISDDIDRLPLAFEAKVKHGTVKGTLYQITSLS